MMQFVSQLLTQHCSPVPQHAPLQHAPEAQHSTSPVTGSLHPSCPAGQVEHVEVLGSLHAEPGAQQTLPHATSVSGQHAPLMHVPLQHDPPHACSAMPQQTPFATAP
jgi:hypothetical protein